MPRTVVDKTSCDNCGVDVRENTLFCYNCGSKVNDLDSSIEAKATSYSDGDINNDTRPNGLDGIEIEPPTEAEKRRAKAAEDRKKARNELRKRRNIVWEPAENGPDRFLLLISLLLAIVAGLIVTITVLWR